MDHAKKPLVDYLSIAVLSHFLSYKEKNKKKNNTSTAVCKRITPNVSKSLNIRFIGSARNIVI